MKLGLTIVIARLTRLYWVQSIWIWWYMSNIVNCLLFCYYDWVGGGKRLFAYWSCNNSINIIKQSLPSIVIQSFSSIFFSSRGQADRVYRDNDRKWPCTLATTTSTAAYDTVQNVYHQRKCKYYWLLAIGILQYLNHGHVSWVSGEGWAGRRYSNVTWCNHIISWLSRSEI